MKKKTALCVAYLKTNNINKSEPSCTAAIKSAKKIDINNKRVRYLQSVSYSNRAVARYLKGNISGAISDLVLANAIDNNVVVKENLAIINRKFDNINNNQSVSYAD